MQFLPCNMIIAQSAFHQASELFIHCADVRQTNMRMMIDDLTHHLKSPVEYRSNSGFQVEHMDACQTGMADK